MCNKALRKHYRALQNVTEVLILLSIITKRYRMLQSVAGHYGMFRSIAEALQGVPVLRSVTEHYGALRDVTGH